MSAPGEVRVIVLDEHESKRRLAACGVPVPEGTIVRSRAEALAAATAIRFPLVLKICSREILHKSDVQGVVTGIRSGEDLAAAFADLEQRFRGIADRAYLLERMAPDGVEMIVGAKRDPAFGPFVLVGFGGVFAEVLTDTRLVPCPVDEGTAMEAIGRLRGAPLLGGARGRKPADVRALAGAIAAVSRFVVENPDVRELDLNPVRVLGEGVVALDAAIAMEERQAGTAACRPPADVRPFFEARSIAVVGASPQDGKAGNAIVRNLVGFGYGGHVYPINPRHDEILGLEAFERLADLPGPVDLAVIAIPNDRVEGCVRECGEAGIRHVIVCSGGFSDIGPAGRAEEEKVLAAARERGIRVMGPNSIGTISSASGLVTSITTLRPPRWGGVAMMGQTGVFGSGFADWIATTQPFGISKVACLGNKGDVDECDVLSYLAADPDTSVIAMYTEGIRDGARFVEAAREAVARKPLVVLKAGRTEKGRRAVATHTGSLAGEDAVYDAIFERLGVTRASGFEDMFDAVKAFALLPKSAGRRIGVVSITGVGCVLAADAAAARGLDLPDLSAGTIARIRALAPEWAAISNPVDIWSTMERSGARRSYAEIGAAVSDDPAVDALLFVFVLIPESEFDGAEALRPILEAHPEKPVLASFLGGAGDTLERWISSLEAIGIPCYGDPERALLAYSRVCGYRGRSFPGRP